MFKTNQLEKSYSWRVCFSLLFKLSTQSALFIRNVHLETPYPIERSSDQLHYTYLDTFGRPVLVATKNNLVEQHIQDMVVRTWSIN